MPATKPTAKRKKRSYTLEQVEAGLHALAISNGSQEIAARLLDEGGYDIPAETLRNWRDHPKHQARYEEIKSTIVPKVRERMAAESEALAIAYAQLERKLLTRLDENLHQLRPAEVASTVRNIGTSRAISVDKSSVLRGMPSEITEHRNADDLLRKLGTALPGLIVEGTATEITDEPKQIAKGRKPTPATALG